MKSSTLGFLPLEIALVQHMPEESKTPSDIPPAPPTPPQPEVAQKKTENLEIPKETKVEPPKTVVLEPSPILKNTSSISLEIVQKEWHAIINKVKLLNAGLSVALQNARLVTLEDNQLHIAVKYKFHQERLNEATHRLTLQEAFDTILGTHLAFCIVQEASTVRAEEPRPEDPLVQHALELLGGSVL
jgi:hypothetical protein